MRTSITHRLLPLLLGLLPLLTWAEPAGNELHATTADGEAVILYPNGRWQYVDPQKAEEATKSFAMFPDFGGCPPGWRGGLLGMGRCVPPDDENYHRGSRIGK